MAQPSNPQPVRLLLLLLPLVGFAVGFYFMFTRITLQVPPQWASYLSLAVLAGVDSILGGVRAGLEGRFRSEVFLSGFIANTIVAVGLAYFGDWIGVQDLYLAAVLLLGLRIFANITRIRQHFVERTLTYRDRRSTMERIVSSPSESQPPRSGSGDVIGT